MARNVIVRANARWHSVSPRSTVLWAALSGLITLLTAIAVVKWVDWVSLLQVVETGDLPTLGLGFGLCVFGTILQTLRMTQLMPPIASLARIELFGVVSVYDFLTTLLPARLGEMTFPALLKMRHGTALGAGVSGVLLSRMLDLVIIASCCTVAVWLWLQSEREYWESLLLAVLLLLAGAIVLFFIFVISKRLGDWLSRAETKGGLTRKVAASIQPIQRAVVWLSVPNRLGFVVLLSLGLWVNEYFTYWVVAQSLHLQLTIAELVLGSSLALLLSAFPVKGLLGLGTQQGGWVLGLSLTGWNPQAGFEVSVYMQLILLSYMLLLGLLGGVILLFSPQPAVHITGKAADRSLD